MSCVSRAEDLGCLGQPEEEEELLPVLIQRLNIVQVIGNLMPELIHHLSTEVARTTKVYHELISQSLVQPLERSTSQLILLLFQQAQYLGGVLKKIQSLNKVRRCVQSKGSGSLFAHITAHSGCPVPPLDACVGAKPAPKGAVPLPDA